MLPTDDPSTPAADGPGARPPEDPPTGGAPLEDGPGGDGPTGGGRRVAHPWRWISAVLVVGFVIAGVGSAFVRVPYYTMSPGKVRDTESRISIEGAPSYDSDGRIDFLTVTLRQSTALEAVVGWLDPSIDVVEEDLILGDRDPDENREANRRLMSDSKEIATYVALGELGYDVEVSGTGAMVVSVSEGTPAAEAGIEVDDTVVAVDGDPVELATELVDAIGAHQPGDVVALGVEPPDGGEARTVEVTLAAREDEPDVAFLGVATRTRDEAYAFPITVDVDTGTVGGPSAGLALTLGIIDRLTPDDLTGGLDIAVTGTMSPDGTVGPVGGVAQKAVAARRAGADLMLVPAEELDLARRHAGDLRVEAVRSIDDALALLDELGGDVGDVPGAEQASPPSSGPPASTPPGGGD